MNNIIENYINGNLTYAKQKAKGVPWRSLFMALREDWGKSEAEARAVADYLKGKGSFQAACDARP